MEKSKKEFFVLIVYILLVVIGFTVILSSVAGVAVSVHKLFVGESLVWFWGVLAGWISIDLGVVLILGAVAIKK